MSDTRESAKKQLCSVMKASELDVEKEYGHHFHGTNFNVLIKNIRTGSVMGNPHHCGYPGCNGPTRKCFLPGKFHLAFCLALITDEHGNTVICGERFAVYSPSGCAQHPSPQYNSVFKEYIRGKELSDAAKGIKTETEEEIAEKAAADAVANMTYEDYNTKALKNAQKARDEKKPRVATNTKMKKNKPAMGRQRLLVDPQEEVDCRLTSHLS